MLEVRKLNFSYGKEGREILKNITCDLEQGHLVAILGNNGAGKSTLLKCLNRIHKAKSGEVLVDGSNIYKISRRNLAQKVAYVAQKSESSHTMVFDTVLLGRRPYIKWDVTQEDKEIVKDLLERFNLNQYATKYIDEMSGGEMQKVVLARALAQQPKYLLLDEPTSNLDPYNQQEMLKCVREVCKRENIGGVVVIHDLNLAIRYCDRFVFIKNAEIYSYGGMEIMTEKAIKDVYKIDVDIIEHKGNKVIVPL